MIRPRASTTRRLGRAVLIAGGVTVASAASAVGAGPTGPNSATAGTLACPQPIGTQPITFNLRTEASPLDYLRTDETVVPKTMFLGNGQVVVLNEVQQEYGLYRVTLSSTGEVIGLDDTNTGSEKFGTGPADRLVECSFHMSFEWTGVLDEQLASNFEVPAEYLGEEVHIALEFDSTVKVLPGRPAD